MLKIRVKKRDIQMSEMALKTPGYCHGQTYCLGAGEFRYSLSSLRNSMLGKFSREDEPDGSLHLSGSKHSLVIVSNEAASFRSDLLKRIINQRVHDGD